MRFNWMIYNNGQVVRTMRDQIKVRKEIKNRRKMGYRKKNISKVIRMDSQ